MQKYCGWREKLGIFLDFVEKIKTRLVPSQRKIGIQVYQRYKVYLLLDIADIASKLSLKFEFIGRVRNGDNTKKEIDLVV